MNLFRKRLTDQEVLADLRVDVMPQDAPFESGFSMKTVWAALFVGFVMLPGAIYLGLVTGQSMAGASEWVTVILFIEIAKRYFVKLKTQEIILLYWISAGLVAMGGKLGSGANLFGGPFGGLIWDQYLIQSPQAEGLSQYIPRWVVPQLGSSALQVRSFLHRDWVYPIFVLLFVTALTRMENITIGYLLFRATNDVEKLPFPLEAIHAGGATALAESSQKKEGWRWRVFSIGAVIGLIWGALYVSVPTVTGFLLTKTITILPIPFIDFTVRMKNLLPATPFAIDTNIGAVLVGFVVPFWVLVGSFASALVMTLYGNAALYRAGILSSWSPGMSYIPTSVCNRLDFYLSFSIGTAIFIALIGIVASVRSMRRSARELRERRLREGKIVSTLPEGRGDWNVWLIGGIWFLGTCASVGLATYLLKGEVSWKILLPLFAGLAFIWSPVNSYINARMVGLTGGSGSIQFPYVREGIFYTFFSGKGAAVWFAPIPMHDYAGSVRTFKQLELTRTNFNSLVKLTILSFVVMWFCSFIFWSLIWRLAPIPSSAYPYVQKMWPLHATMQCVWAKSTLPGQTSFIREIIEPRYVVSGFAIGGFLFLLFKTLGIPTLIFYGFLGGIGGEAFAVLPSFLGACLGRFYFRKKFGRDVWRNYAPILVAGYGCGMGLVGMTSIAMALIAKSVSQISF